MKKEYMNPTMLVVSLDTRQQMLAGSVTSVTMNLDPVTPVTYDPTDPGEQPWDGAMSREQQIDWDDEEYDDEE